MRTRRSLASAALAGLVLAYAGAPQDAHAQADKAAWPQRTVRFIVPFGPGAASDIAARLIAERMQKVWANPVIVENKPGGDGLLSIGAFVSAKDDHVLFVTPSTLFAVHPYQHENLPYDPDKDLQPISWISSTPIGVGVTATAPHKTMKDFVDHAKRTGGKVNYAVGVGLLELVWDGFRREHDVPMSKVPFRDIVQAPIDLGEGRIDALLTSVTTQGPMLRAGKIRLLAITDPERTELAPGVPTVIESGFPILELRSMNVLLGPAHMTLALRQRVAQDVNAAIKDKEIADKLRVSGQQEVAAGPEAAGKAIADQQAQVARLAKLLGMARKKS